MIQMMKGVTSISLSVLRECARFHDFCAHSLKTEREILVTPFIICIILLSLCQGGWSRLQAELDLDTSRLWKRNLGRDDRIVAAHAREVRQPYLDEVFNAVCVCCVCVCMYV